MADDVELKKRKEKKEKKVKEGKEGKDGKVKKEKKAKKQDATTSISADKPFSLLADQKSVDATLSSLFAAKPAPVQPRNTVLPEVELDDQDETAEASEPDDEYAMNVEESEVPVANGSPSTIITAAERSRKRKRKDADDDLEGKYMHKLAQEEEKDLKRQKAAKGDLSDAAQITNDEESSDRDAEEASDDSDEDAATPPPMHETQQMADDEVTKANRTVFLGNVSSTAISSKSAKKQLMSHLTSFFPSLPEAKGNDTKYSVESLRFRSTAFSSAIPKKAAFAKKELMDATTKSTNAYAVYSSPMLSREAAKRLNGTIVLDRHLRVDEVAHPAKVDNRRCVFVGNLGFVDDESNIQQANEEEGRETRKRSKIPADAEEGLWRTFGKCGKVESVRVIRDSTTRVGKGIAYVQFEDENAVEAALLLNEKKFPPMLPRKLRVTRAKAQKKNAKPGSDRPSSKPKTHSYQRKITGEELTQMGRAGKLLGRAAGAKIAKSRAAPSANESIPASIRRPESFVFEGHRASSKSGKSGLKLGKKGKGKPGNRSAKRGAAYKAKQRNA